MNIKEKVLIIEDEKSIAQFIAAVLGGQGYETIQARTGKEALSMLSSHCPDVVILDLGLPDLDGMDVLRQLRSWSSLPVVVVSARSHERDKVAALDAGADDYLTKPFDMDELIARIISLIRRYTRFNQEEGAPKLLSFDGLAIDMDTRLVTTEKGVFELPPKEFDLLLFCAENQGKILTKQRIYEAVWGEEYVYDDSNIMAVISRLRKKLEVSPGSPKYIQTVKGIGYRFNKDV